MLPLATLKEQFNILVEKFYAVSMRERILLSLVLVATFYSLWSHLVYDNLIASQKKLKNEQKNVELKIKQLKEEYGILADKIKKNPVKILDQRVLILEQENQRLSQQVSSITSKLVPPKAMTAALTNILANAEGIKVIHLENIKEVPLFAQQGENRAKVNVYKHGLKLEFSAGYFETLNFLEHIEQLEWKMLWDTLSYEVEGYPFARVNLLLYTLSLQEGWIGG